MLLLIVVSTCLTFGQTTITDNSNVSGTWDLNGSPYIIEGRAFVNAGDNLSIQPGVEVRFDASSSNTTSTWDFGNAFVGALKVEGTLSAQGNLTDSILFTRNGTSGYWGAVIIDQSATANLEFCRFEYAKESRNVPGITGVVAFQGALSFYQNANSCSISKSLFTNNRKDGIYASDVPNNNVYIDNNVVRSNGVNGIAVSSSTLFIRNNELYNNATNATGFVAAIKVSSSQAFVVSNLIYDNNQWGCYVTSSSTLVTHVVNNTIYNSSQGLRINNDADIELLNNIIFSNGLNFAVSGATGTINARNNLTDEASLPANLTDQGGNLVDSNPSFIDAAADNFQLQSTSPCIDNGYSDTSNLNLLSLDLLGNTRVDNSVIDIGALEFQSPVMYNVITSADPTNGGATTGDGSYVENASVTVEAIANPGYNFVNWTENGTVVSTDSEYTFTITANRDLQANFEAITYDVAITEDPVNGGTTSGAGTYQEGDGVTITATPETGYAFVNWTENGSEVSTDATYTFNIQTNREFVANFQPVTSLEQEEMEAIALYPNPAATTVRIKSDRDWSNVVIRGMDGQIVHKSNGQQVIDVAQLSVGTYVVELYDDQIVHRMKFVKVDQ
ncbi:MAG: InlB B-repeat-containing protein [Bacteroidota bacterium]